MAIFRITIEYEAEDSATTESELEAFCNLEFDIQDIMKLQEGHAGLGPYYAWIACEEITGGAGQMTLDEAKEAFECCPNHVKALRWHAVAKEYYEDGMISLEEYKSIESAVRLFLGWDFQ
jgi:hypothetical protein